MRNRFLRNLLPASAALLLSMSVPARADRPLTPEEQAKLAPAVAALGCSGGKMEYDDGVFEVDDAVCADGKTYDLKFDANLKLIKKKLER